MLKRAVAFLFAISLLTSCSKSVEGESKSWERNKTAVQKLVALYPGFKTPLTAQLQSAEGMWKEASSEGDQNKKIEMMAAANKALSGSLVGKLQAVDRQTKDLRKKMIDVPGQAVDESDRISAKAAAEDAQRILAKADETLKAGSTDAVGAIAIVDRVASDLKSATSNLASVAKRIGDKKRAVKAKADTAAKEKKAAAEAKTKAEQAKQPWKCEYCGSSNEAAKLKCDSCGAPHKAKK